MFLEDVFDQIPAHSQEKGYVFDRGNTAQVNHITIKDLEPSSFAFGKIDGLPQSPTTMTAILKMTMQNLQTAPVGLQATLENNAQISLHDQLIPTSPTSSTRTLFLLLDHVVVNGPATVLGSQMLIAHQTQSMIKIACRRQGRSPFLSFLPKIKRRIYRLGDDVSNPQSTFTPAFAG